MGEAPQHLLAPALLPLLSYPLSFVAAWGPQSLPTAVAAPLLLLLFREYPHRHYLVRGHRTGYNSSGVEQFRMRDRSLLNPPSAAHHTCS